MLADLISELIWINNDYVLFVMFFLGVQGFSNTQSRFKNVYQWFFLRFSSCRPGVRFLSGLHFETE